MSSFHILRMIKYERVRAIKRPFQQNSYTSWWTFFRNPNETSKYSIEIALYNGLNLLIYIFIVIKMIKKQTINDIQSNSNSKDVSFAQNSGSINDNPFKNNLFSLSKTINWTS